MAVALDVVCDTCNNTWMSDLTTLARELLEPVIRRDLARSFDETGILTITVYAFLKSAVLDSWATETNRTPCISRAVCTAFCDSLTSHSDTRSIALPDGLQVWIAQYRRTRAGRGVPTRLCAGSYAARRATRPRT